MSGIRERLEKLRKSKGIKSNSDLLRMMYKDLRLEGKIDYQDSEEFVRKTKGSFSQMIDQANGRSFNQDFYLPLEKILDTSMVYLLEGRGEPMPENYHDRGIKYAAATDNEDNYKRLIEEDVYLEEDEYRWTLLDYILENNSKNGLEFVAKRGELPLTEYGCADPSCPGLQMNQHGAEELIEAMTKLCSTDSIVKYFNGYYFVENGRNPQTIQDEETTEIMNHLAVMMKRKDVREKLSDYKRILLSKANPGIRDKFGNPLGNTAFVNMMFNLMLEYVFSTTAKISEDIQIELLDKAYQLNEQVMPLILSLPFESYTIGRYGYIYNGRDVFGSIALLGCDVSCLDQWTEDVRKSALKLKSQIQDFSDKIVGKDRAVDMGREIRIPKQKNPAFYEFYEVMKHCEWVAQYNQEKSVTEDWLRRPEGEPVTLSPNDNSALFLNALEVLAQIDAISESALGAGKTYVFPKINNRLFFALGDSVMGIAPTEIAIGSRYDNLAELLAQTCLLIPGFNPWSNQTVNVANALKGYGIKKKEVKGVMDELHDSFIRSMAKYDSVNEKAFIASAQLRALWCDLYAKEIYDQFK